MRLSHALSILILGAAISAPVQSSAQVNISLSLSKRLGPELSIFAYSQPAYGEWRTSYRQWTPVTIYDYQGHYYRHSVRGSRAVVVYTRNNEYFFPPDDRKWVGADKRYNYKRRPSDNDRGRGRNHDDNGRGRP